MLPATGDGDDSEGKREKDPALRQRQAKNVAPRNSTSRKNEFKNRATRRGLGKNLYGNLTYQDLTSSWFGKGLAPDLVPASS